MEDGDDRKEDNVATKVKLTTLFETLNRSKQNVTKQYKTKDETEPREQKQQSKTISDRTKKKKKQWTEHQSEEDRRFQLQVDAEKTSK